MPLSGRRLAGLLVAAATFVLLGACGDAGSPTNVPTSAATPPASSTVTPTPAVTTVVPTTATPPASTTTMPATTTTTLPPGTVWEEVALSFSVTGAAAVGDTLWAAGVDIVDRRLVLASTADGKTWTAIDLEALGMPMESELPGIGSIFGQSALTEVDGELVALLAAMPQPGVSAESVGADIWLATTDGAAEGGIRLMGPEVTGIDQRLAGPRNFRFSNLGGIAGLGGQIHAAADGQWWVPFDTTDSDFAAISYFGDDPWVTYSVDEAPLGFLNYAGVVTVDDRVVAVGWRSNKPRRVVSYVTTDGTTWLEGGHPPAEGERVEVDGVAAGNGRLVAVGHEYPSFDAPQADAFPVAFWSDDGLSWNRVVLPGTPGVVPGAVAWTGSEFLAVGDGFFNLAVAWVSPDGNEWTVMAIDDPPRVRVNQLLVWNDRLVLLGGSKLAYSPPLG